MPQEQIVGQIEEAVLRRYVREQQPWPEETFVLSRLAERRWNVRQQVLLQPRVSSHSIITCFKPIEFSSISCSF